jgi:hypothetical protein
MELRMSGIGPVLAASQPFAGAPSRRDEPPAPASEADVTPVASDTTLAGWFDRNGDGRIDGTTWMDGGDAFIPVGKDIAIVLNRRVDPSPHPRGVVVATPPRQDAVIDERVRASATAAYEHYGAPSRPSGTAHAAHAAHVSAAPASRRGAASATS